MSITYICSPYSGQTEQETNRNIVYAVHLMGEAIKAGDVPVVPHLYLPNALDDRIETERMKAMEIGIRLLCQCRRMIVGLRFGISDGMHEEILAAVDAGMPILWIDATPEDITVIRKYQYQLDIERKTKPHRTVLPTQTVTT